MQLLSCSGELCDLGHGAQPWTCVILDACMISSMLGDVGCVQPWTCCVTIEFLSLEKCVLEDLCDLGHVFHVNEGYMAHIHITQRFVSGMWDPHYEQMVAVITYSTSATVRPTWSNILLIFVWTCLVQKAALG